MNLPSDLREDRRAAVRCVASGGESGPAPSCRGGGAAFIRPLGMKNGKTSVSASGGAPEKVGLDFCKCLKMKNPAGRVASRVPRKMVLRWTRRRRALLCSQ